jgi:hypothetical protein
MEAKGRPAYGAQISRVLALRSGDCNAGPVLAMHWQMIFTDRRPMRTIGGWRAYWRQVRESWRLWWKNTI